VISPSTAHRAAPARHIKMLLIVFGVRHLLGIALFVWLTFVGRAIGGIGWLLVGGLGLVYAAIVAYNGRRLYQQYRRRLAAEGSPH
jgi:hypothetical protein